MSYSLLKNQFGVENWSFPLAFFVFLILGILGYTLSAVGYFLEVPGDVGDARFNSVILEYIFRWVMGHEKILWNPPFFYPFEGVLAFSENHLGSSIPYIFLRLIGVERELAFDGWFFIGNCLSLLTAYIAMRQLGFSKIGSAAGAFAFAFCLPMLVKEGHAQLIYRFAIPLAYVAFWELITTKRLCLLWWVAFWCTVQFYCSIYLGIFLVYLLIALLISAFILGKGHGFFNGLIKSIHKEKKYTIVFSSLVVVLCITAVLWLGYRYHIVSLDYGFKRSLDEISLMLPRLSSYLIADRSGLSSWIGGLVDGIPMRGEHQMFFGVGVWILGVFGVIAAWQGYLQQELGKAALFSIVILFVATLSVGGYSLYFLLAYIPGFNAIRAVSRIVLVMMLPVSILVAIGVDQLYRLIGQASLLRKSITLTTVIVLLSAEVIAYQPYKTPIKDWVSRINTLKSKLPAQLPANPIIFITGSEPFFLPELDGMILAQELGVPTLNGYSGNVPPDYLKPLPCYSYLNRLDAYAAHRGLAESAIKEISDRVVVVSLSPCESKPVRAFRGKISPDQAKDMILSISDVRIINDKIEATVAFNNKSPTNFNTVSISGPVRLSWRFVQLSPSGQRLSEPGWDARQDLALTIAPGNSSKVRISTTLPVANPENYLLEVSLVQEGVAWLHQPGMDMSIPVYPLSRLFGGLISADQAKNMILNIDNIKIIDKKIEAIVTLNNRSSVNFNTLAIADPVRLSWRFVQISPSGQRLSEPGWDARQDLALAIKSGDSSQVRISTTLPTVPGDYLLEVSIVQDGVAWLHQPGMDMSIPAYRIKVE